MKEKLKINVMNGKFTSANTYSKFSDNKVEGNGWTAHYKENGDIVCRTRLYDELDNPIDIRYCISSDGFSRMTESKDGIVRLVKKGFVTKKGQPLNGTLYLANEDNESYGYFHPYTVINFMQENKFNCYKMEDPNQIYFLNAGSSLKTDGAVIKRSPVSSNGKYAYEVSSADWVVTSENGSNTVITLSEPSNIDFEENASIY